jgi:hypothetical protein
MLTMAQEIRLAEIHDMQTKIVHQLVALRREELAILGETPFVPDIARLKNQGYGKAYQSKSHKVRKSRSHKRKR